VNRISRTVVGELAVHRESLERILQESPESLAAIVEALTDALRGKDHQNWRKEEDLDERRELCVSSESLQESFRDSRFGRS